MFHSYDNSTHIGHPPPRDVLRPFPLVWNSELEFLRESVTSQDYRNDQKRSKNALNAYQDSSVTVENRAKEVLRGRAWWPSTVNESALTGFYSGNHYGE